MNTIYTIGHSTHSLEEFVKLLRRTNVNTLVDVRMLPGSRKFPQFNSDSLAVTLPAQDITYYQLGEDLGGRRRQVNKESGNDGWEHKSFRSYADYMQTARFDLGIQQLEEIANTSTTAYMCAESLWWRCHRRMISDALVVRGWEVIHLMTRKSEHHKLTDFAVVCGTAIRYPRSNKGGKHA